jgi:hypothetical protein
MEPMRLLVTDAAAQPPRQATAWLIMTLGKNMNPREIEQTFSAPHRLPDPIVEICRYCELHGYPISGCFELSTIGVADVRRWFRKSTAAQNILLPFGRGACGDVYSLWLTEGLPPERAPVVMLGSEGQLVVLAVDSSEFCRLLCLGYSEIGVDDPESPPSDYEATKNFRDFIQAKYNFSLPDTAEPILKFAKDRFPSFPDWVRNNQNKK